LTDGLGNDSALALSTGAASITGTLAVSGNATFDTNTLFVDAANNRVGVGTTSPNTALDVNGVINVRTNGFQFGRITTNNVTGVDGGLTFQYITGDVFTNGIVLNSAGAVGIGTSSPQKRLHIVDATQTNQSIRFGTESAVPFGEINYTSSGEEFLTLSCKGTTVGFGNIVFKTGDTPTEKLRILAGGGITFNGDTAAANALDDYEEGTFTVAASPNGSGTITLASGFNTWSYTKIGRKVTVTGLALVDSVSSPVGVTLRITGLPFSAGAGNQFRSSFSAGYLDASASYAGTALATYTEGNSSVLNLKIDCSTLAANDEIHICATYFV
jgi:hypothetical protein